jgi:hypothetical protein
MEPSLLDGSKDIRKESAGFNILISIRELIPQIREK